MPQLNPVNTSVLNPKKNISTLTTTNFLQPTGFKMLINRKNFPNLEYFAQSFTHPDMTASAVELPYSRVSSVPFAPDKISFGELSVNVILDEELNSYQEMQNWLERLVETKEKRPMGLSGTVDYDVSPPTYADITLSVLSSANNTLKQIRYIACMPTSIGSVNFEAVSTEQNIAYPVNFRYTYFEIR